MRTSSLMPISALLLSLACGGDDGPEGPQDANVEGAWTYSAMDLDGSSGSGSVTCEISGLTLTISQTDGAFTGTASDGHLSCNIVIGAGSPVPFETDLPSLSINNGTVSGNDVAFDLSFEEGHHTGTVSGSSMSGTATIRVDINAEPVTLSGDWAAVR